MIEKPFPRAFLPAAASLLLAAVALAAPAAPRARIEVERDGIVRVSDRELAAAGRRFEDAEISRLSLTLRGREVPILLESLPAGSRDGRFALEFLGSAPRGTTAREDPYTRSSAYFLGAAAPGAAPARVVRRPTSPGAAAEPQVSSTVPVHHEENRLFIRFSGGPPKDDLWFWAEVKATDTKATTVEIPVEDPAPGPARLRMRLFGYSHLPEEPDHGVEISWNGEPLGRADFDGETAFVFDSPIPSGRIRAGANALSLRALGTRTKGIDLVLLDWVELSVPRRHRLDRGQIEVAPAPDRALRFDSGKDGPVRLWNPAGTTVAEAPVVRGVAAFPPEKGPSASPGAARAVRSGDAHSPARIALSDPADLLALPRGAEFLVVTHAAFEPAAEKLAARRRAEGLSTTVARIDDIYDLFSDGFRTPEAIRAFVRHAYRTATPRPRYLLLVGDASWDYKNRAVSDANYADWHWAGEWAQNVPKNGSTPYRDGAANDRLFVPTFQYETPWGHAASDHLFGCVDDDAVAEVAVGRFPVATLAEAEAVLEKGAAYEALPEGALRKALFVTNDDPGFQRQTDLLADGAAALGYEAVRVHPKKEEADNRENTAAILRAWNDGPGVVVFTGHGGRYIWRTGPPDLRKNHDLLTLDHVDTLSASPRLPVVVSLTCYSAPFDHPVADSIGEKLLRSPERGGVAVLAASWRNVPPLELASRFLAAAGRPQTRRIGDALREAKLGLRDPIAVATYNLLGDPTLPYRGPATPGETR